MTHPAIIAHRALRIERARHDPNMALAHNDGAPPCPYCEQPGDWKYRLLAEASPWYCLCGFRVGAEW